MLKTKISTFDSTWNPVSGCLHGCEYCYARSIAKRFGKNYADLSYSAVKDGLHVLDTKFDDTPYPYGFEPTFHAYRLNDYVAKKGRNIFVCSMADLFGNWVPNSWIDEVMQACERAPQHNYLFLTKNPVRYLEYDVPKKDNMWYGTTITDSSDADNAKALFDMGAHAKKFLSIEPILSNIAAEKFWFAINDIANWVIIGAETGHRNGKVTPKREWIEYIVSNCKNNGIPLFMKKSLAPIWGEPLIQEFPAELRKTR